MICAFASGTVHHRYKGLLYKTKVDIKVYMVKNLDHLQKKIKNAIIFYIFYYLVQTTNAEDRQRGV